MRRRDDRGGTAFHETLQCLCVAFEAGERIGVEDGGAAGAEGGLDQPLRPLADPEPGTEDHSVEARVLEDRPQTLMPVHRPQHDRSEMGGVDGNGARRRGDVTSPAPMRRAPAAAMRAAPVDAPVRKR